MVVTPGRSTDIPSADELEVIWHDLECGSYRADLPLWRELAVREPGPILEDFGSYIVGGVGNDKFQITVGASYEESNGRVPRWAR